MLNHLKQQGARLLSGLLFALTLAPPVWANQQAGQEKLAVGTWYGEYAPAPNQPLQRFIVTRLADGSFSLQARLYEKGKIVSDLRNRGLWGISNGMYFTVTTEVNGERTDFKNPGVTHPYLVRTLSQGEFEYQHIPSGNKFRVVRVDPATARLPD